MISRSIFTDILWVVFFIALQIFVLNRLDGVFGGSIPVVYPFFILFYPFYRNISQFLIMSFIIGLGIDAFMGIWGTNAFACVVLAYFRTLLFRTSTDTENSSEFFSFQNIQWAQFLFFILSGIFLHQWIVQMMEFFKWSRLLGIILNVSITTVISFVFITLLALVFKIKQKN